MWKVGEIVSPIHSNRTVAHRTHTMSTYFNGNNVFINCDSEKIVEEFARGCYQEGILRGDQRWSGADLRGKARTYGARYEESRRNLCERIADSYQVEEGELSNGLRVKVFVGESFKMSKRTIAKKVAESIGERFKVEDVYAWPSGHVLQKSALEDVFQHVPVDMNREKAKEVIVRA
jgi:hypothetical protein